MKDDIITKLSLLGIVIKPGQAGRSRTQSTRGLDQSGFVKRPVGATTRLNPVDPAGQPVTRVRPDVFFYGI
jgi:hypothetical protein